MKYWKLLLLGMAAVLLGLIGFSLFWRQPGPVDTRPISEQTKSQSEQIDELDPFSEESRSQTDMLEGTVGY
ncbi:hypothetical protein [Faecalibaculum rodentium]|uniref:hypothetical protein n=1 Tax=Faecalibaculum rodentium TaxID=1702221 RepID=UPI0025B091AA|nr:hypothetical protein [Faecalibaculum rodentium]